MTLVSHKPSAYTQFSYLSADERREYYAFKNDIYANYDMEM